MNAAKNQVLAAPFYVFLQIQLFKFSNGNRRTAKIALSICKSVLLENALLLLRLHSFNDNILVQDPNHPPDFIEKVALAPGHFILDKALINLHHIRRHICQHRERRIAGSEIVDGHAESDLPKTFHTFPQFLYVLYQHALCYFNFNILRRHTVFGKNLPDTIHKIFPCRIEMSAREICGYNNLTFVLLVPFFKSLQHFLENIKNPVR